jgi:hypothetical protein
VVLTVGVIAVTAFIYRAVLKPYQEFCFYKKILTNSYKTLVHPFSLLGIGVFGLVKKDEQKYGDSQYSVKMIYPSFQVALTNYRGYTVIELCDSDLIKEFYEKQMGDYYLKFLDDGVTNSTKLIMGNGLAFSEG